VTKIKEKIFSIIKYVFLLIIFLTLILFIYSAFFFDKSSIVKKEVKNEIIKEQQLEEERLKEEKKLKKEEKEKLKKKEEQKIKKQKKLKQIKTNLKDGIFAIVENKAITRSDIVNEIKKILILNNMSYSEQNRNELQQRAVKSVIERSVKLIEIKKNTFLEFNPSDLNAELNRLANQLGMNLENLEEVCKSNGLDFSLIKEGIKTDLLWNSLIFYIYRDRITVNLDEIEEQLRLGQNKKEFDEYLISEIVLKRVESAKLQSELEKLENEIKAEGFEKAAMKLSISQSAIRGGDLGWLNENQISKNFRSVIFSTPVGSLSPPIFLKDGILVFKVRDKRKIKEEIDLEELKNRLVNNEKTKMLSMYSSSHYDNLRRSIAIKFFDE
tara:strand:- start:2731 stop:3879 length:1149 start_codon:yes stop_codon:yes gene_type:complete